VIARTRFVEFGLRVSDGNHAIIHEPTLGTRAAASLGTQPERITMMKELNAQTLEIVAGGASKSDQLNQTLTQVQSSSSSLAQNNNNNNGSSNTTTMLMLALAMQNRQQQTVVAAPAAQTTVIAQPAFRFRARFRF
jgi:hypothetical protein